MQQAESSPLSMALTYERQWGPDERSIGQANPLINFSG